MLPGFNHNIRYRDRVFHVQTEDNGVTQKRLVTQVFIDGHVLALERGSYAALFDDIADDKTRTDAIREQMQDQHKSVLKRLVSGELDDRIAKYLGDDWSPPESKLTTSQISKAAEDLPTATQSIPDVPASQIFGKEPPANIKAEPPARPGQRKAPPRSSSDFLSVLDEEMARQTPIVPKRRPRNDVSQTAATRPNPPAVSPDAPAFAKSLAQTTKPRDITSGPRPGKPRPPGDGGDTLVDFGLPASLRETIERKRIAAHPQAQTTAKTLVAPSVRNPPSLDLPNDSESSGGQTPIDLELRRGTAPKSTPNANGPRGVDAHFGQGSDTLLEVDAGALHRQMAEQRARLRNSTTGTRTGPDVSRSRRPSSVSVTAHDPNAAPLNERNAGHLDPPGDTDAREKVVVDETPLDEVLLNYLDDE